MDRDTRKLLRHSRLTAALLVRWAFRGHRYVYTMALLMFVLIWRFDRNMEAFACGLLPAAFFILLFHIVQLLDRFLQRLDR